MTHPFSAPAPFATPANGSIEAAKELHLAFFLALPGVERVDIERPPEGEAAIVVWIQDESLKGFVPIQVGAHKVRTRIA